MKLTILVLLVLLSAGNLYAFDYASYKLRDLDEIIIESKKFEPEEKEGQALLIPLRKVHLYEKLVRYPFKCEGFPIKKLLTVVTGKKENEQPSITTCMQIESKKGDKVWVYIQDSIAVYVEKEYKLGQKIHLCALWLFINHSDKKPYFVINAIGEESDEKDNKPKAELK